MAPHRHIARWDSLALPDPVEISSESGRSINQHAPFGLPVVIVDNDGNPAQPFFPPQSLGGAKSGRHRLGKIGNHLNGSHIGHHPPKRAPHRYNHCIPRVPLVGLQAFEFGGGHASPGD